MLAVRPFVIGKIRGQGFGVLVGIFGGWRTPKSLCPDRSCVRVVWVALLLVFGIWWSVRP